MNAIPQAAERDWRTPLELTLLGAIWGCSFLFMRVAVPSFGPFAPLEVRLGTLTARLFDGPSRGVISLNSPRTGR